MYLHIPTDGISEDGNSKENPTGAVVFPISMATTFRQKKPGSATLPEDPNSFGKGYEYSRTGDVVFSHERLGPVMLFGFLSFKFSFLAHR